MTTSMRFNCSFMLPRDASMVPVARHVCRNAMEGFGVDAICIDEVTLALTEACANVVQHSEDVNDSFEVVLEITEEVCVIRVIDRGRGFDPEALETMAPGVDSEQGRGVLLMKALVDVAHFESKPEEGTIVHLEKRLWYDENADSPFDMARRSRQGAPTF